MFNSTSFRWILQWLFLASKVGEKETGTWVVRSCLVRGKIATPGRHLLWRKLSCVTRDRRTAASRKWLDLLSGRCMLKLTMQAKKVIQDKSRVNLDRAEHHFLNIQKSRGELCTTSAYVHNANNAVSCLFCSLRFIRATTTTRASYCYIEYFC
jgi:hypothetical protein